MDCTTKVYLAKTPTHAVGVFVSEDKQSLCPGHSRSGELQALSFNRRRLPASVWAEDTIESFDSTSRLNLMPSQHANSVGDQPDAVISEHDQISHAQDFLIKNA